MARYVAKRLLHMLPTLFGVSLIAFLIIHLAPGSPAVYILGDEATPEAVERLEKELGLDQPLHLQFGVYLMRLLHGDLGESLVHRRPVLELIGGALPATLELALLTMVVAVVVAIPLGVVAAVRQRKVADGLLMTLATFGVSAPFFWVALMLIIKVSYEWRLLPSAGRALPLTAAVAQSLSGFDAAPLVETLRHLALPVASLAAYTVGFIARITRSQVVELLHSDYVRTARAKGLAERVVLFRHVLRNALLPVITLLGLQLGTLLGGAVVTETVFAWPGMGRLVIQAIKARDYPTVQGAMIISAAVFTLVNLAVDLLYGILNPRVRYE